MTNNHMIDSVLAIVMGIGAGMLLSVGGQKLLNNHYQRTCNDLPKHSLILQPDHPLVTRTTASRIRT
jgi:hypothetical protein